MFKYSSYFLYKQNNNCENVTNISMLKYAGVCQLCIHKGTVDLASPLCRSRNSADVIEIQNGRPDNGQKEVQK